MIGRRDYRIGIVGAALTVLATGCDPFLLLPSIRQGTYSGALDCTMTVTDPSGATASEDYAMDTTVVVDESGGIFINDVELVIGAMMLRAVPNADLQFEVTRIGRAPAAIDIELEPRPTLPGITIDGTLEETYGWEPDGVHASGKTDLLVTDVSGTSTFVIRCAGFLPQQDAP